MDAKSLVNEIFKEIHVHDNLKRELDEYKRKCEFRGDYIEDDLIDNFESDIYNSKVNIAGLLDRLYYQSALDNYIFFDCQLKVYKAHYEERIKQYKTENPDTSEKDFLRYELNYFFHPEDNRILLQNDLIWLYYNYSLFINPDNEKFKTSLNKKIDFLKNKLANQSENSVNNMNTSNSITSAQIVKDLIKNITGLRDFYQGLESSYIPFDLEIDSIKYEIERETGEINFIEDIKKDLNELYLQSNKDNFYFFDCPLKAYLANIDKKIKDYKKLHIDANMIDFYKTEINYLLNPDDNRLLYSHNRKNVANYNNYCNDFSNFEITLNKKIEYITNELVGLGVETTIEENYIGRDSDQLIKTPVFKKINRPYTPEKVKIIIPATQEKIINITKPPSSKKSDYNTKIFRNKKAEEWFLVALDELNAIDENKKAKSGFQSRVSAIFYNDQCKKEIFKYHLKLNEFISFLKSNFNANITSDKKLSSGFNHVDKVQDIVKQYVARKPE